METSGLSYDLLTILGPTASGKTELAAHLAKRINGEVISADSRQVYRKMNLGTGKDYDDYNINGYTVPYHLIDIVDAGHKYNLYQYQADFIKVYNDILLRNRIPILCGGSGLYLESVLKGYKLLPVPENSMLRAKLAPKSDAELIQILSVYKQLHNQTDIDTRKRMIRAIEIEEHYLTKEASANPFPAIRSVVFGVKYDRAIEKKRIEQRLESRLKAGMINEVNELLNSGLTPDDLIYYGLEYKFITQYIIGEISWEEMFSNLNIAIRQFAKRQMTWFRRMERNGIKIHWIEGSMPLSQKLEVVLQMI